MHGSSDVYCGWKTHSKWSARKHGLFEIVQEFERELSDVRVSLKPTTLNLTERNDGPSIIYLGPERSYSAIDVGAFAAKIVLNWLI